MGLAPGKMLYMMRLNWIWRDYVVDNDGLHVHALLDRAISSQLTPMGQSPRTVCTQHYQLLTITGTTIHRTSLESVVLQPQKDGL